MYYTEEILACFFFACICECLVGSMKDNVSKRNKWLLLQTLYNAHISMKVIRHAGVDRPK